MTATRDTTPFLISAAAPELTWTAGGVPGGPQNLPGGALVNPYNVPVEIRDLLFWISSSVVGTYLPNSGIEINLRAGRHGLTNGYAPLVVPGPLYQMISEETVAQAATVLGFISVRWVFPRPMILKPGAAITGSIRLSPNVSYNFGVAGASVVTVTARGRKLPPGTPSPIRGFLPFMSGEIFNVAGRPVANNLSFMNTLAGPLEVTSINAQAVSVNNNTYVLPLGNLTVIGPGGPVGTPRRTVVPVDSLGDGVFGQRDSIEISHTLQRGESYLVTWDSLPAYPIAMTISGYREEVL